MKKSKTERGKSKAIKRKLRKYLKENYFNPKEEIILFKEDVPGYPRWTWCFEVTDLFNIIEHSGWADTKGEARKAAEQALAAEREKMLDALMDYWPWDMVKLGEGLMEDYIQKKVIYADDFTVVVPGIGEDEWHTDGVNMKYDIVDFIRMERNEFP